MCPFCKINVAYATSYRTHRFVRRRPGKCCFFFLSLSFRFIHSFIRSFVYSFIAFFHYISSPFILFFFFTFTIFFSPLRRIIHSLSSFISPDTPSITFSTGAAQARQILPVSHTIDIDASSLFSFIPFFHFSLCLLSFFLASELLSPYYFVFLYFSSSFFVPVPGR